MGESGKERERERERESANENKRDGMMTTCSAFELLSVQTIHKIFDERKPNTRLGDNVFPIAKMSILLSNAPAYCVSDKITAERQYL